MKNETPKKENINSFINFFAVILTFVILCPPIQGAWKNKINSPSNIVFEIFYFTDGIVNQYEVTEKKGAGPDNTVISLKEQISCFANVAIYKRIGHNKYLLKNYDGHEKILYVGWFTMKIFDKDNENGDPFVFYREFNFFKVKKTLGDLKIKL